MARQKDLSRLERELEKTYSKKEKRKKKKMKVSGASVKKLAKIIKKKI